MALSRRRHRIDNRNNDSHYCYFILVLLPNSTLFRYRFRGFDRTAMHPTRYVYFILQALYIVALQLSKATIVK